MVTTKPIKLIVKIALTVTATALFLAVSEGAFCASIKGQVTYEGGYPAISGVRVSCGYYSVSTDSSGRYEIRGLDDGYYTVTPSKYGYSFSPSSASVSIRFGMDAWGVNFTAPKHYIDGYVKYDTEQGIPNVRVWCGFRSDSTDSNGYYKIQDLINGSYTVYAEAHSITKSTTVWIDNGNKNVDFTFETYSISGTVTYDYDSAKGVAGVEVAVGVGTSNQTTTTDPSGYYTISHLPPNDWYTVKASKSGYTINPSSKTVYLGNANASFVNFSVITPKYTISGTLKYTDGQAIKDTVWICSPDSTAVSSETTGQFSFGGLPAGNPGVNWWVAVPAEYVWTPPTGSNLIWDPEPKVLSGTGRTVYILEITTTDRDISGLDFTAETHSLSGRVSDYEDDGIEGASITCTYTSDGPLRDMKWSATTEADGTYVINGLYNGEYKIEAEKTE